MLLGNALMRALMFDGRDDAGLAILPCHSLDAGEIAQLGTHAVTGNDEPR